MLLNAGDINLISNKMSRAQLVFLIPFFSRKKSKNARQSSADPRHAKYGSQDGAISTHSEFFFPESVAKLVSRAAENYLPVRSLTSSPRSRISLRFVEFLLRSLKCIVKPEKLSIYILKPFW